MSMNNNANQQPNGRMPGAPNRVRNAEQRIANAEEGINHLVARLERNNQSPLRGAFANARQNRNERRRVSNANIVTPSPTILTRNLLSQFEDEE